MALAPSQLANQMGKPKQMFGAVKHFVEGNEGGETLIDLLERMREVARTGVEDTEQVDSEFNARAEALCEFVTKAEASQAGIEKVTRQTDPVGRPLCTAIIASQGGPHELVSCSSMA